MSAIADDAHESTFIVPPAAVVHPVDGHDETPVGAHARPVDVPAIVALRHPSPERRRYFLSSFEPSGDYDAVIVAVTHDGRRRYFTTRDGASLTEVDEVSFERRRESGTRSMLELDERELGELEVELEFVRPVRGRDPIAEAQTEVEAHARAEVEAEVHAEPDDVDEAHASVESDDLDEVDDDPPPHRSTFVPIEVPSAQADDDAQADDEEEYDVDDPMTEEFEAMVLESTTVTSEQVDAAASVLVDETDAAPERSAAAPMSATDATTQVALARGIAFVAHRGQHDRSGLPYIDHPGRIAERFDPVTEPVEAAAAWLHDVLEDSDLTAQELFEAGVVPAVIDVVQLLTRTRDVAADEYYARIRRNPVARRVKLADIDDNTARWRLRRLDYDTQLRLVEKYRNARLALGAD